MLLTPEQIEEAVSSTVPSVLAGLRKEISERALNSARETALAAINKAVSDWCITELVPEIHRTLAESKDGLVSMVPTMASGVIQAITDAMADSIKKKLETSWQRQQIFKALLE